MGTTLVTGVNGLIGAAVARRLCGEGRRVVGMDRVPPPGCSYPFLSHDLPDPQRWHEAIVGHHVSAIVHAGGVSGPMVMPDAPARALDINVLGLYSLLEAARIHNVRRVVWFSSILAYGAQDDLTAVPEARPLLPDTVYGAGKAAGEALIRGYRAEHGLDAVALRVASCYGPGRTTSCLIRTLVEDGLNGRTTQVADPAGVTRQHVFVEDVVDAVCVALEPSRPLAAAYNIGPGEAQTLPQLVDAVREAVPGVQLQVTADAPVYNVFPLGPLEVSAARRDLDFSPSVPLSVGAELTRQWVTARGHG
ncbi:NAD-dependent epimerase/dehydratase family protein [Ornithinicoccus halotolerans]|uniref:NAD-dependent epimerase/dehydratase family protein n=1 Tax=Ornithinicoccus halotolerans TaxID=1748220 RepID=UPI0012971B69|nr:NAD(P)-dependent oxidoreductase [Ornithinicoccus halotolerans]